MLPLFLVLAFACAFKEEVLWVDAPPGLQSSQARIQKFFNSSNLQLDQSVNAYVTTPSEATGTALFTLVTQERPVAITAFVNQLADELSLLGVKGMHDDAPKCQWALVTVLELWSNIPFASTCVTRSHDLHLALERIAKAWAHLLNEYTCMHEAIQYRDYGVSKKMMLLAMSHAMDLTNLRYFDHVEVLSANERDKSHPSDELPLMDLFESINNLVREQGTKLLRLLENEDHQGITQWKTARKISEAQHPSNDDQDRALAHSFIFRERVRQLPPDQSRLLALYDEVITPLLRRQWTAPARRKSKSKSEL